MQLNLRKAHALQQSIADYLSESKVSPKVKLEEFQDPESHISIQDHKFNEFIKSFNILTEIRYEIRKKISRMNVESGISDQLADLAFHEKNLELYENIISAGTGKPLTEIKGKLSKLENSEPAPEPMSSFGRRAEPSNTIVTSVLSDNDISDFKNEAALTKNRIKEIKDDLLLKNINTNIELDADHEEMLKNHHLI